ncbi:hypothetical protein KM176_07150 [Pseudooceanicola sp. CBS1P-1]|uniref:Lipoprotein n=1 Tax=Pseudooceanicola albus TaxID=2692189 RepID=A0A6L7G4A7_9RHOB|nr:MULTISPECIES: hypothetical protein [Pseudooceanicola]MBT9383628.1 hypothetical protein [Pseudooceanicola endophyticus]MXN17483.1 hypothetical protein [Pseudooceanicola albus]
MRKTLALLLIATTALSACGHRGPAEPVDPSAVGSKSLMPEGATLAAPDDRPTVAHIDSVVSRRLPGGTVIEVTATAPIQGVFDVSLKSLDGMDPTGPTRHFALVGYLPQPPRKGSYPVGSAASRKIVAAVRINDEDLATLSSVEVRGSDNSVSIRP